MEIYDGDWNNMTITYTEYQPEMIHFPQFSVYFPPVLGIGLSSSSPSFWVVISPS